MEKRATFTIAEVDSKQMNKRRILHISYSNSGGAGKVAKTLCHYQNMLVNYESQFHYQIEKDLLNNPLSDFKTSLISALDNFVIKKQEFNSLFSLYRSGLKKFEINKLAKDKENWIVHFHWITGMLNMNLLNQISTKSIVWTLHDFEPITGGCHSPGNCLGYEEGCVKCPAVHGIFKGKVASKQEIKSKALIRYNKIKFVVPSKWMYKKISQLDQFRSQNLHIIPNPIDEKFLLRELSEEKKLKEIKLSDMMSNKSFVIGFISQRIDDPLKRFALLIKIVKKLNPIYQQRIIIYCIGGHTSSYDNSGLKIEFFGNIEDTKTLVERMILLDVVVSLSESETFGLSLYEAGALGVPSIVMAGTATEDVVRVSKGGLIANSEYEFKLHLEELIHNESLRARLGQNISKYIKENLTIEKILKQYDDIYKNE